MTIFVSITPVKTLISHSHFHEFSIVHFRCMCVFVCPVSPCPGHVGIEPLGQGKKQEEMQQASFPHYCGNSGCNCYDLIWTCTLA